MARCSARRAGRTPAYLDGPEQPTTEACRAAVATGAQALYDWNEVNLPNTTGQHRMLIPDGRRCSAGRDKYKGFDLARADWPATPPPAGTDYRRRRLHLRLRGDRAHLIYVSWQPSDRLEAFFPCSDVVFGG